MSKNKLTADLDRLIKRAAEVKATGIKKAEDVSAKLDKAEDGTVAATTGAHAADNKAEAAKITAGAVDGGAKDNQANGSVANNTDGSKATATDGQKGPAAGEFPIKGEADNGPTKGEGKFAGVRKLANDLRAAADGLLTGFDKFLVKSARASEDKQVKTAAEGMGDDELADQASDALMEQIAAGQVSDADAEQILQEAVQAGAITPDELEQAAQLAHEASGGAEAEAAPSDEEQMKVAAAQITPEHPKYLEKLASIYDEDMRAGYAFFTKLASELVAEAEKAPAEEKEEKAEEAAETPAEEKAEEKAEGKEKAAPLAGAETPAEEKKEQEIVDAMSGVDLKPADDAEKQALEAVKQELGLNDGQLAEIAAAPLPAPQDKVAAAKAKYRSAIMAKVAALKK
jgi:hypothetical protein